MTPLVFLDFAGVLASNQSRKAYSRGLLPGRSHPTRYHEDAWFDPRCVEQLNRITSESGAEIVLSTSWRLREDCCPAPLHLYQLCLMLKRIGVEAPVVGWTPSIVPSGERGDEVARWLTKHGGEGRHVVVLDDGLDMDAVRPWFVPIRHPRHLDEGHADEALRVLAGPPWRPL